MIFTGIGCLIVSNHVYNRFLPRTHVTLEYCIRLSFFLENQLCDFSLRNFEWHPSSRQLFLDVSCTCITPLLGNNLLLRLESALSFSSGNSPKLHFLLIKSRHLNLLNCSIRVGGARKSGKVIVSMTTPS